MKSGIADDSRKTSVLFLEDSDTDFELAAHGLRKLSPNLSLRRFDTGRALTAYAATRPLAPDLIVVDVRLPDGDGLDAIAKLRATEHFQEVPIVVFSSSAHPEQVRRAERAGAAAYRVKPLDAREYIRTIQDIVRHAI